MEKSKDILTTFLKIIFYFCLTLLFVVYLFWPLYQEIHIEDSVWPISQETPALNANTVDIKEPLNFPINEEYLRYLPVYIPITRHKLCFKNNNHIYLIHSDSNIMNFNFTSPDLRIYQDVKENKVGAMAIVLEYSDSSQNSRFYREIGQDFCEDFNLKRIEHLASSTIEYRHMSLEGISEIYLKDNSRLILSRVIGKTHIATESSKAIIKARWSHLIIILIILWSPGFKFLFKWLKPKIFRKRRMDRSTETP